MPTQKQSTPQASKASGFTIIEVVIVLAIAGIIVLIVFLAVPSLQRNMRNQKRKRDVALILAYIRELHGKTAVLPQSCNNTDAWCWNKQINLGHYDVLTTANINVSFFNRDAYGPFNDATDAQLDPTSPNVLEHVTISSWSLCNSNGNITGVGANKDDVTAQFALEGGGSPYIACLSG